MPFFRHQNEICLPLITKLTCKAVQVVNVVLGPHHHLKGRDELTTGGTVSRYTEEPGTANIFFQILTGSSEMRTRVDASTPCKAINTQCLMMYTSKFYSRQMHKYSSLIHTQLTFHDENHISFEEKRKRQIHQEAYITAHKQVNGGEFAAKKST